MRNFDVNSQFEAIKRSAISALNEVFPVRGKNRTIKLENVWVEDKADPSDYKSQAAIKSKDGTWGVPIYASLAMVDNSTGKTLDRSSKVKMFNLPKVTDRFSYIVKGNEYQVTNQLRLKPGVYTIKKQNGELKTQVNLAKGKNFELSFNEDKGLFSIQKIGGGQANIPLYPLLIHLGISPSLIAQAWGQKLESANKNTDQKIIERIENAFSVQPGGLKDYFKNTSLSGEVTKSTLGKEFSKVDGPMLLESAKSLLNTHLGKKEPDDRDSLEYKELHGIEDFIQERIEKNKSSLAFKVARGIDNPRRTTISQILNPTAFSSVVESFFTTDDKSNTSEQTNPLEMLSGAYRTTIMGSGGIGTERAVTPAMREIHPTHYGFIDPIHSPESSVGVNLHLPLGTVKDGKDMKMAVKDRDGKSQFITPHVAYNSNIAFPNQQGESSVKVMRHGKVMMVPKDKVDYYTPHSMGIFSASTNLVPYLQNDQGNRAMMASKMLEQAIALKNREAPLVQVGASPTKSMEQVIGENVALKSPYDGVVKKIDSDSILIKTTDGVKKVNRYNNFVLNSKSFLHHEPVVKVGDPVKKGQLLADSNYTKDGTLALGTNIRTAYVPFKGQNFDDGIVITESAAEKLTSEHIYKKTYEKSPQYISGLTAFKVNYPNGMSMDNAGKLDVDGVIKKGEKVKTGDVIIAALRKRTIASGDLSLLSKKLSDRPKDDSVRWVLEDDGIVQDVQKTSSHITVFIKTEEKAKIGDKLAGRHGNKGVITAIIPDGKAPHDKAGNPVEMILNPNGVISRINIGQTYESAAAKAALKEGKPYVVKNFTGDNYLKATEEKLKSVGIDDKEELINPETGKPIGRVHVGNPYTLKLFKQSTSNYSVRQGGPGAPYDANMQPLKAGGEESSKNADLLTMYSMLSNGARVNLREMASLKSTQNDEFWKALKSGQPLPPPKSPYIYDKFIDYLKGAGINVEKNGSKLTLSPLTDKQVMEMSSGAIEKPFFYRAKDLQPIKGGLFDPVVTGGFNSDKWSHIPLTEPVLNPVFETATRKILGMGKNLDKIIEGSIHVDDEGKLNSEGIGVTGGAAVEKLLKNVDIDKSIEELEKNITTAKGTALDNMNKKLRYLLALKKANLKPDEAYIRRVLPVVPTAHRPIYPMPNGSMTISDVNHLYHNVSILNNMSKLPINDLLPEEEKANLRKDMYNHVKGLSGLTDLSIKGRERKGFISEIKGGAEGQPKQGMFISKLLSKKQDFVGRGTIIPEPDLNIDEMAMPENMAWKLFEPFLIRELGNHGKTPLQAKEEIDNKTDLARRALELVMKDRKVLLNRAPSLHKFSIMAFKPKITDGKALKIPPLVNRGFNADHDGDTMTLHLPITDEANREAESMLPSRNLFQPGTGKLMIIPSQEAQVGLYYLSKTPQGREELNKHLPAKYKINKILDKKETHNVLRELAQNIPPNEYGIIVSRLKSEGEKHAYERGFTLGLEDLAQFTSERDKIVNSIRQDFKGVKDQATISKISDKHIKAMDNVISKKLKDKDNPLFDMIESGAKGSPSQLRSLLASPLLVTDAKRQTVLNPIRKSYAEGLDMDDYWTSMYGARRGMMDRSLQTSEPGAFSKDILAATVNNVVSKDDCGTKEGVLFKITDPDLVGRYTAGSQGSLSHNTLIDASVLNTAKKSGLRQIKARSPLRCLQPQGTCAKCYGLDEHFQTPDVGTNIGAKAGQTIAEPLVQMIMNCSEGNVTDENGNMVAFEDFYNSIDAEEGYDGRCYTKTAEGTILDDGIGVGYTKVQKHLPDDDMYFIKTKTGHSILVQGNHPVWIYKDGEPLEVRADEVSTGDMFKITEAAIHGNQEAPFPPYFIGRYLADGCTRYGNGTKAYEGKAVATIISGQDVEVQEATEKSIQAIQEKGTNLYRYPDSCQIYSPKFASEFSSIIRGREARKKRLPGGFNKWSIENLERLLAGYIDGDSSVFLQHGITVAQIYTSSYVLLQQMEAICHKLDIRFTPQVVTKRPEQKTPAFVAQLRFKNDNVRKHSVKMKRVAFTPTTYDIKRGGLEPVTYIKKLWMWDQPVWDVKTSSRGFTCGMIRNHNSFHTGGTAGGEQGGYGRIHQLLHMPKVVVGSATLAPKTGIITDIKKGLAGGYDVTVGGEVVHVSQNLDLKVKKGDHVTAGDPLSTGVIKPQDLVKYKGMDAAQDYIATELQQAYQKQGVGMQKKIFETVVRSLGNTTKIINNPKDSDFVPGDVAPYTVVNNYNQNLREEVDVDAAEGHTLDDDLPGLKKGQILSQKDINLLKARGLKKVAIRKDPIKHEPILKGITAIPLLRKDWMATLGYRNLAKNLVEGAGQRWETDLSGYHPIPAFAHGATFGQGPEGKY